MLKCPKNEKSRFVSILVAVSEELKQWQEYQDAFADTISRA